jgi:hypothetical protein
MMEKFAVREFQFYNAFEGFSRPPGQHLERWHCTFSEQVSRNILRAYTEEVANLGGRSWLLLQMMAVDVGDSARLQRVTSVGQKVVNDQPILDIVVPTPVLADAVVPAWAEFAASLNFSGIHWSTLGNVDGLAAAGCDIPGFLRTSLRHLEARGLSQTANFIDGFGWDSSLYTGPGEPENAIAFPYWAAWSIPRIEDRFFAETRREACSCLFQALRLLTRASRGTSWRQGSSHWSF